MDIFGNKSNARSKSGLNDLKPLADRMRPKSIDKFFGQEKVIGEGTPLRNAIENDKVTSLIFWGPPGTGKTTLGEVIACATNGQFVKFSAVTSGIKDVKQILTKARNYYQMSGRRTYVFIDEIHRFNKTQQDAFLPYVESGDIVLIGATTENPSFEVNSALLSRLRVFVLERLNDDALRKIFKNALIDKEFGLGLKEIGIEEPALDLMINASDGDARRGLTLLDETVRFVGEEKKITLELTQKVHQRGFAVYDKKGEEHFNIISALHKSLRGGDPDASLYWLARMLHGGEDPKYIIRRLIRFASEDIGLADPYALTLCLNAKESFLFLGSPEGELAIAQAVIYMACAPKSNSIYIAFKKAMTDADQKGSLPVPLWIRNAPTSLMKNLGYGKDYKYAHNYEEALTDQEYFPEDLSGTEYYKPKEVGREKGLSEYLAKFKEFRKKTKNQNKKENE